jgi:site-specific recombinase XerD
MILQTEDTGLEASRTISTDSIFDLLDIDDATRTEYKNRIIMFLCFIKDNGCNRNGFLDYKRYLAKRNDYSTSTKNKYLATARIYLRELSRIGQIPSDITQNVKSFKQDKKHKRDGLNDEEMLLLIEKIKTLQNTPENTRKKAILSLLTLQGLRQIELVRLNVKDLDFVGQTAFIQGKGRDDKEIVYLHPETLQVLKEYLQSNHIADGALFTSRSNNSRNKRLTTKSIRNIVQDILHELGIAKTTHGFRHYFTTKLIKTYKGDLLEVARYTRHKNLEMLQIYNDNIKQKADLPRFYGAFEGIKFNG